MKFLDRVGVGDPAAISARRQWYSSLFAVLLLTVIYFIAPITGDDDPLPLWLASIVIVLAVVLIGYLIGNQVRRTFADSASVRLARLTVLLTLSVLAFAVGYFSLERASPGEIAGLHTRLDSLYFTLVTIGTIGYGDIHPAGQVARGISCLQIVFNAVFIGALIRIILFQINERAKERQNRAAGTSKE